MSNLHVNIEWVLTTLTTFDDFDNNDQQNDSQNENDAQIQKPICLKIQKEQIAGNVLWRVNVEKVV